MEPKPNLITFRGGFVADWRVVESMIELEDLGHEFRLLADGRVHVTDRQRVPPDAWAFLRKNRETVRAIVQYMERITAADVRQPF